MRLPVLVPNDWAWTALGLGAREVAVFASATESFAKANLNRTVDEALAMFEPVVTRAVEHGLRVRGYLSMCFGDPWEGPVPLAQVVRVRRRLVDMGCDELSLGDTIGVATPGHVAALLTELGGAGVPVDRLAVHFHDTYGQALATPSPRSSTASASSTCPRAASAAARTRRARPGTSPPRTSCGCFTASASKPGSISAGSPPRACGWPNNWAAPALPVPSAPSPTRSDPLMSLDHRLSAEHEELRRTVEQFAHDVIAPKIGDFYERHEFPYEIVREMGRMGLFGLPFPEEYGGMGGDYLALGIALEELARVDSSVAITLEAGVPLGAMPIHLFGTEEQKRQWLPRLCSGELLGAFGLTEPDGGSDAGGTRTTAVRDGDEWVINGSKCFITNSAPTSRGSSPSPR